MSEIKPWITNCTQKQITEIVDWNRQGMFVVDIAEYQKISAKTCNRYIRVFDMYGLGAFVKKKPKKRKSLTA